MCYLSDYSYKNHINLDERSAKSAQLILAKRIEIELMVLV